MKSYWHENLEALSRRMPELFALLKGKEFQPVGHIYEGANGVAIRLGMQGQLGTDSAGADPWQQAEAHLASMAPGSTGLTVFMGLGLGYGPLLVLKARPDICKMVIIEPSLDLFAAVLKAMDLRPLFTADKVSLHVGDIDFARLEKDVEKEAAIENTHFLRHAQSYQWRPELYAAIGDKVFDLLNRINVSGSTTKALGPVFFKNRFANLSLLRHQHPLDRIRNIFAGKPAVLVAAGPSLDRTIPLLKEMENRCVLIAVDSALAPLLRHGISPDFVTTLDMVKMNFEKMAPFLRQEWPFSLVSVVKGTPLIPKRVAARHHFLAFQDDLPQAWMMQALGVKTLLPLAHSVANLSLGLALALGANPVIFVGQDLALTGEDSDHAQGTLISGAGLPENKEMFWVKGKDGGQVRTIREFLSIKKVFEDIIAASPGSRCINASAAGAHIEGTESMPFAEAAERFLRQPFSCLAMIDEAVRQGQSLPVGTFADEGNRVLRGVNQLILMSGKSLKMGRELHGTVSKLLQQRSSAGEKGMSPALKKKISAFDRLNQDTDSHERIWEQVLELTFPILRENESLMAENKKVLEKEGYVPWLQTELRRISLVNRKRLQALQLYKEELTRLLSHLQQEEKLLGKLPDEKNAARELARLYCASGDLRLASKYLAGFAGDRDAELCLITAEVQAGLLDLQGAEKWWRQAGEAGEKWKRQAWESRSRQVDVWLDAAEENIDPDNSDARFPQIMGKWLERIELLLDPEQPLPERLQALWRNYESLLKGWIDTGQDDVAAENLAAWEKLVRRIPAVKSVKARLLLATGQFDDAVALLMQAVAADAGQALLWEEIGDALASSADFRGAIAAYEQCFLALPGRVDMLWKMGDCYLQSGQHEPARAAYEAALGKDAGCREAIQGLMQINGQ